MMRIHTIGNGSPTDGNYLNRRYTFFLQLEESGSAHLTTYIDTQGNPSIGIGFNLRDDKVLREVLITVGFDVDAANGSAERGYIDEIKNIIRERHPQTESGQEALINKLNHVMERRYLDPNIPWENSTLEAFTLSDSNCQSIFETLIAKRESTIDRIYGNIPASQERLVLLSLLYNGVTGPRLQAAVRSGNRAEAWFEIRYSSNGDSQHAARRYIEAELFGLTRLRFSVPIRSRHHNEPTSNWR